MYEVNGKEYTCAISIAQDIFNDKWKLGIIWHLLEGENGIKSFLKKCAISLKKP